MQAEEANKRICDDLNSHQRSQAEMLQKLNQITNHRNRLQAEMEVLAQGTPRDQVLPLVPACISQCCSQCCSQSIDRLGFVFLGFCFLQCSCTSGLPPNSMVVLSMRLAANRSPSSSAVSAESFRRQALQGCPLDERPGEWQIALNLLCMHIS